MKILVGYGGTNRDLLSFAGRQAKAFKGEVLLVNVLFGDECKKQSHIDVVEDFLEAAKSYFDEQNIPCQTFLLARGQTAGEVLVLFAEEKGVDEIIIGVKRRSKVGKLLFGSTAQYVILNSPCPVITMK